MKKTLTYILFFNALFFGCSTKQESPDFHQPDWNSRKVNKHFSDSLKKLTYLPVYAQIYEISEQRKVDLAATVSIRNTDLHDTIFISKISYFNTEGQLIRNYINDPIYVKPMETIEVIIKSNDNAGGTGANFIFEWHANKNASKPLFESVMISTSAQQGISFTSRGVDLSE